MLALILALPLELAADRLEARGDTWWADGVVIQAEGLRLTADAARGFPDAACPEGRVRFLGPVEVESGGQRAQAAELELCLPGPAVAQRLALRAPRLALQAERAAWADGTITADGVEATTCACDPPPWRVTARRAEVAPGEGAWAEWPVLWVGPVPVATVPRWYLPLARRRTGFLFPIMGFDGEDGVHARQPFFLTLGQSADLTLAPGYRQDRGLTGHTTLRWAATEHETGTLEARWLATEGGAASGRGSLPVGPVRFTVEGTASTDEMARQALWPGLAERARDHLRGTLGAAVAGRRTGLGFTTARLEDLTRPTGAPDRVVTTAPDLWLRWHAAAGPAELTLAGRALTVFEESEPRTLTDVGLDLEIPFWIGPLLLRPVAGGATTIHLDEGQGQTGAWWTGGDVRLAAARRFGALRHELALVVDARYADAAEPARGALLAIDLPLSSRAVGATAESRLSGEETSFLVALRVGHEGEAPVEGFEAPLLTLALEHASVRVEGGAAGTDTAWLRGEADGEHLRAHLGATRLRPAADTPTLRRLGPTRPLAVSTLTGDLTTAEAGAGLTVGPLGLDYALVTDDRSLLAHEARLQWTSACDCWSARLVVSHETSRDLPDIWLSLQVP